MDLDVNLLMEPTNYVKTSKSIVDTRQKNVAHFSVKDTVDLEIGATFFILRQIIKIKRKKRCSKF